MLGRLWDLMAGRSSKIAGLMARFQSMEETTPVVPVKRMGMGAQKGLSQTPRVGSGKLAALASRFATSTEESERLSRIAEEKLLREHSERSQASFPEPILLEEPRIPLLATSTEESAPQEINVTLEVHHTSLSQESLLQEPPAKDEELKVTQVEAYVTSGATEVSVSLLDKENQISQESEGVSPLSRPLSPIPSPRSTCDTESEPPLAIVESMSDSSAPGGGELESHCLSEPPKSESQKIQSRSSPSPPALSR